MTTQPISVRWRSMLVGIAGAVTAATLVGVLVPTADAAGRVTVSGVDGRPEASASEPTQVTVRGTGFQSMRSGFGGIYVMFGWVSDPDGGSWAPSRGGAVGDSYKYVPDAETANNQGYQRFVAFPGSDTASAANGGVIAEDGSWSTTLTIPGSTFQAVDRGGAQTTVDCLEVTCGVITIGAHGVKNANNETFTPVRFVTGAAAADPAPAATEDGEAAIGAPTTAATAVPTAPATVGVDASGAVAGRVLSFTGQGFLPGEQVVGTLSGGLAGVGPLTAGTHGEVAGVLQLPSDLRPGTHTLRLTGAASGQAPQVEFTALADPVAAAAAANATRDSEQPTLSAAAVALALAGLLLLAVIVSSFVTARRRAGLTRRTTSARPLADTTDVPDMRVQVGAG